MKVAGKGHGRRGGAAPVAEINVIPLVDVVLVLLVIFMMTTAFVKDHDQKEKSGEKTVPQLPLQLPQSGAAVDSPVSSDTLILGIDKEGKKFVDSVAVTTTLLHQRVREAALKNPESRVRIDADRDTRFQDIVEVIELCQFEGMRNVGLHIAKDKQP